MTTTAEKQAEMNRQNNARSIDDVLVMLIPQFTNMLWDAIKNNKHNVIPIWGEMGLGKTSLAMWTAFHILKDWDRVKKIVVFTFDEMRALILDAVTHNYRLGIVIWDDIAVYFHRASIQYMHPAVKDFFSKYNFIRPYMANLLITTPNIEFIPRQLLDFTTADILVSQRGKGDFDRSRILRKFSGSTRTYRKNYDGRNVVWGPLPPDIQKWYDDTRHAHSLEAFERPEEIFLYNMPPEPEDED